MNFYLIAYQEDTAPARMISPVAEMKAAVHKAAKRLYLARVDTFFYNWLE